MNSQYRGFPNPANATTVLRLWPGTINQERITIPVSNAEWSNGSVTGLARFRLAVHRRLAILRSVVARPCMLAATITRAHTMHVSGRFESLTTRPMAWSRSELWDALRSLGLLRPCVGRRLPIDYFYCYLMTHQLFLRSSDDVFITVQASLWTIVLDVMNCLCRCPIIHLNFKIPLYSMKMDCDPFQNTLQLLYHVPI